MAEKPSHAKIIHRGSVRVSLNGDTNGTLRAQMKKNAFEPNGFVNDPGAHGTGLWVNPDCSVSEMRNCMKELWKCADKSNVEVDHVWSNFEMIDLRSLSVALQKNRHDNADIQHIMDEFGWGRN